MFCSIVHIPSVLAVTDKVAIGSTRTSLPSGLLGVAAYIVSSGRRKLHVRPKGGAAVLIARGTSVKVW